MFKKLRIQSGSTYKWVYVNPDRIGIIKVELISTDKASPGYWHVKIPQGYSDITLELFSSESDALELTDRIAGFFVSNENVLRVGKKEEQMIIEQENPTVEEK